MASVEALEAQEIPPKVGEWLDKTRHPTIKKRFLMFEHEYKDSGGAWTYTDWRRHQSWSRYESRTRLRWRVASGEWRVACGDRQTHSLILASFSYFVDIYCPKHWLGRVWQELPLIVFVLLLTLFAALYVYWTRAIARPDKRSPATAMQVLRPVPDESPWSAGPGERGILSAVLLSGHPALTAACLQDASQLQ